MNIAPENLFEDLTDAEERAIIEIEKRRQELQEISSSRMKTNWEEVVSPHRSRTIPNPELDGLSKDAIRGTANAWQERESGKARAHTYGQRDNAPTRRIGNMFSPSSNQWKMDDDDDVVPEDPVYTRMNQMVEADMSNMSGAMGNPMGNPMDYLRSQFNSLVYHPCMFMSAVSDIPVNVSDMVNPLPSMVSSRRENSVMLSLSC